MKDYFKLPSSGKLPNMNIKKLPASKSKKLPKMMNGNGNLFNSGNMSNPFKMDIMKDIMNSQNHIKNDVTYNYKNMEHKLPRSSMGLPKVSNKFPSPNGRTPKVSRGLPDIFGGLNISDFDDTDTDMDEAYDGFSEGKKKFKKQTKGNLTNGKTDIKFGRSTADLGWGQIAKKPTKGMFDGF